jgi:hypothetical protein
MVVQGVDRPSRTVRMIGAGHGLCGVVVHDAVSLRRAFHLVPPKRTGGLGLVLLVAAGGCVAVNQDAEPAVVIYPCRASGARWE